MKLSRIFALLALVASMAFSGVYTLDQSHTRVGFKIKHLMISNVYGSFGLFDGSIKYDNLHKKVTEIYGEVDASSIFTDNEKRDEHLRSADFFDVAKHEMLTLKSIKVDGEDVYAKLTIKGITKDVKLEIEDLADIIDPKGKHRIGFTLEGVISRKDFGLTWNKVLETGGLMVDDIVKIVIEIEAIEQ
jgi:polyisoprenoid-binding protein YceI